MSEFSGDQTNAPQAYRVLARKYRPARFSELIGQDAMVRTLFAAIGAGRLPQAWILTGVRGIGKTTTARIIAKALNCTGRKKGGDSVEPCCVCETCRAIAEDRHVDVQEMDAASRTGVEDIREIIESVRYGPVSAAYKIYILDEVHMLSKNAFNALLKTLEEPPPHTKFIFATTEIRKVPVTVLSRCQRFDLRRIETRTLAEHFSNLARLEKVDAEEEAVRLIARAADGSVRDGLSLLDQAIALGEGKVRAADVKEMLGLSDRAATFDLCRYLLRGEMGAALGLYGTGISAGTDPLQLLRDLAGLVHFLSRAQIVSSTAQTADISEEESALAQDLANVKIPALARAWQILLKGIGEVHGSADPVAAAEMVLIRLAYAAELPLPGDLIRQLRERKSENSLPFADTPPSKGGGVPSSMRGSGASCAAARVPQAVVSCAPAAMPATFPEIVALFAANREGGLYAELVNRAHLVRLAPGRLEINLDKGADPKLSSRVAQCLSQWTGRRWMVAIVEREGALTLREQEKKTEQERQEKALAHPLMQAVRVAFPEVKLVSLKSKCNAPLSGGEDKSAEQPDENGEEE